MQLQSGMVQLGFIADLDVGSSGIEFPLGLWQLARSHIPIIDAIQVRAEFIHDLAREEKRCGGGQEHSAVLDSDASGARDIVEGTCIPAYVVRGAGSYQVRIVLAAVEDNVTLGVQNACGRVIGHFVGV